MVKVDIIQANGRTKVSADDATLEYLSDTLAAGPGIDITVSNPGGDEGLLFSVNTAASGTHNHDDRYYTEMELTNTSTPLYLSGLGVGITTTTSGLVHVKGSTNKTQLLVQNAGSQIANPIELKGIDGTMKAAISGTGDGFFSGGAVSVGTPPTGLTNDYGIYTLSNTNSLALWSTKASAANATSVDIVADVNAAAIDADHKLLRVGWVAADRTHTEVMNVKPASFELVATSSAEILGTEADGASTVAVTVGSESAYATPGAKLLSVTNGSPGNERANIDYLGSLTLHEGNYGQAMKWLVAEEEVTIVSGSATSSVFRIPAFAVVAAVGCRVTTTIPTASGFDIGIPIDARRYGFALSTTAGVSCPGTYTPFAMYQTSTPIVITPNTFIIAPNVGKVKISVHYMEITPPQY